MPDPEDAMYKRHYYILESLAVVKSCFLVHDVGDEDLVIALMECLFRAATPQQGRKAIDHMYNIVNVCLDDEVSLPVCATVMQRLVPGGKTTEEARKIARVCLQTNVALQQTCGHLALEIFHGSAAPCVARLRPKLAAVIEVLMYSNEAMLRIIPGLSAGIEAEDVEVRLSVVAMLGKIYSVEADASDAPLAAGDPALSYAAAHQAGHFKAFLGRFQDVSARVRSAMCEHGAIIMKAKPAVAAHIEPFFNAVLDDEDHRVRDAAVQGEFSFGYRYILRESCSQFDSLPLTSLTPRCKRWRTSASRARRRRARWARKRCACSASASATASSACASTLWSPSGASTRRRWEGQRRPPPRLGRRAAMRRRRRRGVAAAAAAEAMPPWGAGSTRGCDAFPTNYLAPSRLQASRAMSRRAHACAALSTTSCCRAQARAATRRRWPRLRCASALARSSRCTAAQRAPRAGSTPPRRRTPRQGSTLSSARARCCKSTLAAS